MVEMAAQPGLPPRAMRSTALLSRLTDASGEFMPWLDDLQPAAMTLSLAYEADLC